MTEKQMRADLIIKNSSQLISCASAGKSKRRGSMSNVGLIPNGAIAIEGSKIIAVGETETILRGFESENVIDARGKILAPGFVDPHTHIVFAGERFDEFELKIKGRDYLEILASGGGILSTVKQTRLSSLSELVRLSLKRSQKMLASGTTTLEAKTGYGLNIDSELKMLDAISEIDRLSALDIVPTFLPAHTFPQELLGAEEKYVQVIIEEMLPQASKWYKSSRFSHMSSGFTRPMFADVFCEQNAFSFQQATRILEAAKALGFGLKAHVDEFTNLGFSAAAIKLGATSIDHLDHISENEIKLLSNSETIGVITPTVNFNFGSAHFADARKLIDEGCAIALSTDYNPGSAPCPSQPMAMQIACRYQKLLPSEAFTAATINSAVAIGLGKEVGSLEVGKQADLLILDTTDYREVCYEFGWNCVEQVIKKGEIVFDRAHLNS